MFCVTVPSTKCSCRGPEFKQISATVDNIFLCFTFSLSATLMNMVKEWCWFSQINFSLLFSTSDPDCLFPVNLMSSTYSIHNLEFFSSSRKICSNFPITVLLAIGCPYRFRFKRYDWIFNTGQWFRPFCVMGTNPNTWTFWFLDPREAAGGSQEEEGAAGTLSSQEGTEGTSRATCPEGERPASVVDGVLACSAAQVFVVSLFERRDALGSDGATPTTSDVIGDCRHLVAWTSWDTKFIGLVSKMMRSQSWLKMIVTSRFSEKK